VSADAVMEGIGLNLMQLSRLKHGTMTALILIVSVN